MKNIEKLGWWGSIPAMVLGLSLGLSSVAKADYIYNLNQTVSGFNFGVIANSGDLVGTLTGITFNYSATGSADARSVSVVFGPASNLTGFNRGGSPTGPDNISWTNAAEGIVNFENFPGTVSPSGPVNYTFDVSSLSFDGSSSDFYWVTYGAGTYTGTITLVGLSQPPPPSTTVPDGGSTLALMGLGMLGLGAWRRRKA